MKIIVNLRDIISFIFTAAIILILVIAVLLDRRIK